MRAHLTLHLLVSSGFFLVVGRIPTDHRVKTTQATNLRTL